MTKTTSLWAGMAILFYCGSLAMLQAQQITAEASMVRNADRILVVSRDLQHYYSDRYDRDTIYVPNGVETADEAIWKDSSVIQTYGLSPRGYILFLGRLVPEKRVEDLIAAYSKIRCA